ncbi:metal-dependent transcriptional regulator [Reichenbachiella versicolor]|uniref:metal-dependent transcriptional regulator n=1 Tax=Reichenbachiella versicolor TaxID=1821036 RepID=UPI000D6E423C|nr:metal-dependent transcriptional regulator [Reichenbachiella versicolor]
MATITEENYLKAIFHLSQKTDQVSISDLSKSLEVSKPTVNSMVKNLKAHGYISYEKYKPIALTKVGLKVAALILRKHRLTEMYLVEKMGFGWEEVHEIAEQVEHIESPAFFDRMDELMGYPTVDPHGSPIPDKKGEFLSQNKKKLNDCGIGSEVIITALRMSSKGLLEFLDSRGIALGSRLKILSKSTFDNSVMISYEGKKESLSDKVSERLLVEEVS